MLTNSSLAKVRSITEVSDLSHVLISGLFRSSKSYFSSHLTRLEALIELDILEFYQE